MDLPEERLYLLGVAVLKGVVPVASLEIRGKFGPRGEVLSKGREEWQKTKALGISLTFFDDPDYPALLKEIRDPPAFLYVRGVLRDDLPSLALVGARRATPYGRRIAREWAREVVLAGAGVVSGLALGVDAEAHRGALEAGGYTVAVLGSGLDVVYPYQNRGLAEEIVARGGALISEFPLGAKPERWHFPHRNRLIAGLAQAVLVVEAAERSGSLITARLAVEAGREVLAVPGSVFSPQSRGTHYLLKEGAYPATSVEDLLEALGLEGKASTGKETSDSLCDDPLLEHIPYYPKHFDEIAAESGLSVPELSARLLELELRGLIQELPGKYFQRIKG